MTARRAREVLGTIAGITIGLTASAAMLYAIDTAPSVVLGYCAFAVGYSLGRETRT